MRCHRSRRGEGRLHIRRQLRQGTGDLPHCTRLECSDVSGGRGRGGVGFQIGGSFTDVVMLFMNDHALQSLLSDKFKIGADATVAAGPVGRHAAAGTDIKLNAEILTYSRSKGAFAGVSLDGAVVQADQSGERAMYGSNVTRQEILNGTVAVPKPARSLLEELTKYAEHR